MADTHPPKREQATWTRATIGDLHRHGKWVWLTCPNCGRRKPVALAQFVIRMGADAPADDFRGRARCGLCGHRGALTQVPQVWGVSPDLEMEPFPMERR